MSSSDHHTEVLAHRGEHEDDEIEEEEFLADSAEGVQRPGYPYGVGDEDRCADPPSEQRASWQRGQRDIARQGERNGDRLRSSDGTPTRMEQEQVRGRGDEYVAEEQVEALRSATHMPESSVHRLSAEARDVPCGRRVPVWNFELSGFDCELVNT